MRHAECYVCQAATPLNHSFLVGEQHFCQPCLEQQLSELDEEQTPPEIVRCFDPTVCVQCEADNGDEPLETIAELPVCAQCEAFFRNRPFPAWLKIASVVFLCVTVAAFVYNWRFFMAYVETLRGSRALAENRMEEGTALFISAGERVPEVPELRFYSEFFKAQKLLSNKPREALKSLESIRHLVTAELRPSFDQTVLYAESSLAFEKEDYDTFLAKSKELEGMFPDAPMQAASVASALACKYVETKDIKFKEEALEKLNQAMGMEGAKEDEFLLDYENRILHRLEEEEIISPEEFQKRFPDGWSQGNES